MNEVKTYKVDGVEIRETSAADLEEVKALWEDGEVMKFVGFPEGLKQTDEELADWISWIEEDRPGVNHYSIYENGVYCGESFYNINPESKNCVLDIKLKVSARGRGIASRALKFTIEQAFSNGAECVWVDPNPENKKALELYRRIGMIEKEVPEAIRDPEFSQVYFELRK